MLAYLSFLLSWWLAYSYARTVQHEHRPAQLLVILGSYSTRAYPTPVMRIQRLSSSRRELPSVTAFICVGLDFFIAILLRFSLISSKNSILSMMLWRHPTRIPPLVLEFSAEYQPFKFIRVLNFTVGLWILLVKATSIQLLSLLCSNWHLSYQYVSGVFLSPCITYVCVHSVL